MNVRKPHPYEYLQRTKLGPTNLEIDLLITSTGVASARMSGCPCSPPRVHLRPTPVRVRSVHEWATSSSLRLPVLLLTAFSLSDSSRGRHTGAGMRG